MSVTGESEAVSAAVEKEAPPAPEAEQQPKPAEEQPAKKERKAKAPKEKNVKEKQPRKPKAASHPPYFQMIKEALQAMNEKSGSSPYAIAKYMEEKHKSVLPANFKKMLALQLKNSAAKGKLIKIKASYKLSETGKKEKSPKVDVVPAKKPVAAKKQSNRAKPAEAAAPKKPRTNKRKPEAAVVTKKSPAKSAKKPRKVAAAAKPKQPKSIKSPAAKRAKKATAAA